MKSSVKIIIVTVFLAIGLLQGSCLVVAQSNSSVPGVKTPVDRLQAKCTSVLPTLRRIHTSDSLMRVNIGQYYNSISVRLMARLNSRLALNRIDSSKFVEITNRFELERSAFAEAYNNYEIALASLIKTDCQTEPTKFYAKLLTAREARNELAESVRRLNDRVSEYQKAVEDLKQQEGEPRAKQN